MQGITAVARDKPHQDARLDMEGRRRSFSTAQPDPAKPATRLSVLSASVLRAFRIVGYGAALERKRAALRFVTGWRSRERPPAARRGETAMAKAMQKITLQPSRDIPFNKLVLSQANVRRIKAGVSIEELAEDIARRKLLQSLNVRPVLDGEGDETGMFEVPAGGRRYRALELLVKQKRLARTAPIPCIVRTEGLAEEDSLAENVQRAPLHPLDQFRAFQTLREKGLTRRRSRPRSSSRPGREAAPEARIGLAEAARRLCRGRHDARPAHGVHGLRTTRARSRSGSGCSAPTPRNPTTSVAC